MSKEPIRHRLSEDLRATARELRDFFVQGTFGILLALLLSWFLIWGIGSAGESDHPVWRPVGIAVRGLFGAAFIAAGLGLIAVVLRNRENRSSPLKLALSGLIALLLGAILIAMGSAVLYTLIVLTRSTP